MTEPTPSEPSMSADPATPAAPEPASTGQTGGDPEATAGVAGASGAAGADESRGATTGESGDDEAKAAGDGTAVRAPGRRRLVLVLVGVAVAALLVAAAVIFAVTQPGEAKVGDCIRETDVVSCEEPHDARIVQVVGNANGCVPPATHSLKEAEGRYLCVVEEAG